MYRFTFIIYMYVFICTLYLYILTHKWFASSSRKHVPKLTVFQDTCSVAKFPGVLSLKKKKNHLTMQLILGPSALRTLNLKLSEEK